MDVIKSVVTQVFVLSDKQLWPEARDKPNQLKATVSLFYGKKVDRPTVT